MLDTPRQQGILSLVIVGTFFIYYTILIVGFPFLHQPYLSIIQRFFPSCETGLLVPALTGTLISTILFLKSYSLVRAVVGISGATCSGKTTICNILRRIFVNSRVFNQDDYYWKEDDSRHVRDENSVINWEILSGFDMKTMHDDILDEIHKSKEISKKTLELNGAKEWRVDDIFTGADSLETKLDPANFKHVNFLLVEGILVLNDPKISDLCDYRFFLELDYDTCWSRRQHRTYDPQDQEGYFTKYAWPYYVSNKQEFESLGKPVTFLNGAKSIQQNLCNILNVISKRS